jgi:two-component system, OmpR family, copper resistance phosphate regulon response regulator CusR
MSRLLIVEDQKKLLGSLQRGLTEEGFEVVIASSGEEGFYQATTQDIDLVVLDVMLPRRNGFEVLHDLRHKGFAKPVLMLTARDAVEDRVKGLDEGADDYLVKPFAFAELLARIRALLRREMTGRELVLRTREVEVNLISRRVVRDGEELELTPREFELLEYLLRHKNATVTREMMGRDIWREPYGNLTNVIDVYINALRKKLERPGKAQLIQTVRGVGYVLRDEA